jgi:hypothetical protein
MKLETITSIHYVDYYHVTIDGSADTGFYPDFEHHVDTSRERMSQYYLGTPDWNITVFDLNKGIAWNYQYGHLTHLPTTDLKLAYDQDVQASLGSWLSGSQFYIRSEYIDDKLCDVFTDSIGTLEWVWREHRLPIQRRTDANYDNLYQVTYIQKRNIQINKVFPDSLFAPPE